MSPAAVMNQYVDAMSRLVVRDAPPFKARSETDLWIPAYQSPEPQGPPVIMLNATRLSELLASNVDPKLYPRMFAMSPAGTLIAYSATDSVKELRDQASLVSMVWKDHETALATRHAHSAAHGNPAAANSLETLTVEFENCNIIIRAVQPRLLLVLVGAVPPSRRRDLKMTPERRDDPRYPSATLPDMPDLPGSTGASSPGEKSSPGSDRGSTEGSNPWSSAPATPRKLTQREEDMKLGILHIQRKKLDAMCKYIRDDFEASRFVLPDAA